MKNIFLWIAIVPGSVLAGIAILFPLHWVLYITLSNFIEPYPEMPERLLAPLVSTITMVRTAAIIAPSHKMIVALLMGILLVFIAGSGFALGFNEMAINNSQYYLRLGGIPVAFGIVGVVVGVVSVYNDSNNT